ncbi:MAG TPA: phosphatase PAP2 family protein [Novosphingobium sp.]|nr:phosphatase PAP2 family protein [Novosphingobium sp.]HZV08461.1 phosphatase PAP2 family protein [Novosphingobium sp.]
MKKLLLATALMAFAPLAHAEDSAVRQPAEKPALHYLNPADVLPQRLYAQPPVAGSTYEKLELDFVRADIASASPERLAQAKWDEEHENPTAFNEVLGRDLTKLPATWDLLITIQDEAYAVSSLAKDAFDRQRPFGLDHALPTCEKVDYAKTGRGYPSGHATVGYAVGWTLARLMPDIAPGILSRADEYAQSRSLCAAHFPSDTAASKAVAMLVAERLINDPRLADKIAAARKELSAQ